MGKMCGVQRRAGGFEWGLVSVRYGFGLGSLEKEKGKSKNEKLQSRYRRVRRVAGES